MKLLSALAVLAFSFVSTPTIAGSTDFSVQGISLGMSLADVKSKIPSDFSITNPIQVNNMPAIIFTAIKPLNEGFTFYFLSGKLVFTSYSIIYAPGREPNRGDFLAALQDKYGKPVVGSSVWNFDQHDNPIAADSSCSFLTRQTQMMPRVNMSVSLYIPSDWIEGCFKHIEVMVSGSSSSGLVQAYYVRMGDDGPPVTFLKEQADNARKAEQKAAQDAKRNAPKL